MQQHDRLSANGCVTTVDKGRLKNPAGHLSAKDLDALGE